MERITETQENPLVPATEQQAGSIAGAPEWMPDRSKSYVIFGFTGQGQQRSDMFEEWYGYSQDTDAALRYFHKVTDTPYGKPLDNEELKSGLLMQPANVTLGVVGSMALGAAGIRPNETFGHSLGELSAVYSANCISADEIIWLARKRGECTDMNIKELAIPTGMMAVISKPGELKEGLSEKLSGILEELGITETELGIANSNSPGQIVISGESEHFGRIKESLHGIAGAIKLKVDGAYHSSHMYLAKKAFQPYVDAVHISKPQSYVDPTAASPIKNPALYSPTSLTVGRQQKLKKLTTRQDVEEMLVQQLTSGVLYRDLIDERLKYLNRSHISRLLGAQGANEVVFVEIGGAPPNKPTDQGVLIDLNHTNVAAYHRGQVPIRYHRVSNPKAVYESTLTEIK